MSMFTIANLGDIGESTIIVPSATVTGTGTISVGGYLFVNNTSGGPITLTLSPDLNPFLLVKDTAGNAATYPTTITYSGGIDGRTSIELANNYEEVWLAWNGSNYSIAGSQDPLTLSTLNVSSLLTLNTTDKQWSDDTPPAVISRLGDRAFVGAATEDNASNLSPAGTFLYTVAGGVYGYLEKFAAFSSISAIGAMGVLGAAETLLGITPGADGAMGHASLCVNNNTTVVQSGYIYYGTGYRITGTGSFVGGEIDVANAGNAVIPVPAIGNYPLGMTVGWVVHSGGEAALMSSGLTLQPASVGLLVGGNGSTFDKGILIHDRSGASIAIEMVHDREIKWAWDATEAYGNYIVGGSDTSHGHGIYMSNLGVLFQDRPGTNIYARIAYVSGSVTNRPYMQAATGGNDVVIGAESGINISTSLSLLPQGAEGVVKITNTVFLLSQTLATGASTATMTNSPVAGNPEWLLIAINGGSYYIPAWFA